MENKDKKDMSVDELVEQLKLVLEIDEDGSEEKKPPEIRTEKVFEADSTTYQVPHITIDSDDTMAAMEEKVRQLDAFFEESEKDGESRRERRKREKAEKKKQSAAPKITFEKNDTEAQDEEAVITDTPLDFSDEIEEILSNTTLSPYTEETYVSADKFFEADDKAPEGSPTEETAAKAPETPEIPAEQSDDEFTETDTSESETDAGETVTVITDEKDDEDAFITEDHGILSEPDDDEDDDDDYDSPFVHDATESDPIPQIDESTKFFDMNTTEAYTGESDDGDTVQIPSVNGDNESTAETGGDNETDISGFDSLFSDSHAPSEDGYTAADEAIMDAFAEKEGSEKPENEYDLDSIFGENADKPRPAVKKPAQQKTKYTEEHFEEFTSFGQRRQILEEYKKKYARLKKSITFSAIFAFLVLVYECLTFFADKFPHFCSPQTNPAVFILIDLQLFAFCAISAYKSLLKGAKGIFTGKSSICSIAALSTFLTFVYGIVSAICGSPSAHPVMSAAAIGIVFMQIAEYRYIKRDTLNFRVISADQGKERFVFEKYVPGKNSREEKEFYDYIPENASMLRVTKTKFNEGFVGSNLTVSSSMRYLNIIFPVLTLIFAAMFAVLIIITKDFGESVNHSYTAFALCSPIAIFTALTLPSYVCAKKTYADASCVISEAAAEEYADTTVATFEDSDVFPPSHDKITSVRLYNNSRMDHIMYVMTSLFRKLGGPLLAICENASKEFNEYSDDVAVQNVAEHGVEATVDSQKVYIGSAEFMGNMLDKSYREDDRLYENNEKSRIMYMIINDVVCAKFYIEYEMDPYFLSVIKQLSASTRCVAIRTLDPNIDMRLIKSYMDTEIYHCKVMRTRENARRTDVDERSSGGIVSRHSVKALLRTLLLCDKTVYSSKVNRVICLLSVIIALIFSAFMIFTHSMDSINTLHVIAYQLLLAAVIRIVTKFSI